MNCPKCGEAAKMAELFHGAYERLAPKFGYKTREGSARPWAEVPEQNRNLMIAVAVEVLAAMTWECKKSHDND